MRISVNVKGIREYLINPRYDAIQMFFAMQAVAIAERFHVFFGMVLLFIGFVISAAVERDGENDAK